MQPLCKTTQRRRRRTTTTIRTVFTFLRHSVIKQTNRNKQHKNSCFFKSTSQPWRPAPRLKAGVTTFPYCPLMWTLQKTNIVDVTSRNQQVYCEQDAPLISCEPRNLHFGVDDYIRAVEVSPHTAISAPASRGTTATIDDQLIVKVLSLR